MLRYSSGLTLTTTTPKKPNGQDGPAQRKANVCRLRLTLPPEENSLSQEINNKTERTKKQLYHVPNGLPTGNLSHGVVYGVVRRSDDNHNKEMVVYGWSTQQLKEEMKYIRDVRLTLENVRKKMYGEYDEMKRKIQELTNELAVSSAQQESLDNHIEVHSAALNSFSEMNNSLTSASIELQKTLVDVTLENTVIRDQIKNLKQTHEQSMEKLKEKQKQLETARVENELLKLKVECSQEANAEVMREMTRKLYSQYEEKLREEEQKHKLEKETLISETNRLLTAIEDANKKMRLTEMSLQEKDQRIGELDQFILRMEDERHQLQKQLIEYEIQLNGANLHSQSGRQRSHQLEEVTASLRERIKHLDDMVLCQQKKVKHMVEEIELQKRKMKQKELFILQLLEKISFLEGENKELQDRLDYLMESQSRTDVETRDVGVGCDLPLRKFVSRLPDKGKKISNFVEKLKIAIAQEEELQRTTELLSAVRLEFQEKQEAIKSSKPKRVVSDKSACQDPPLISEHHYNEIGSSLQNKQSVWTKKKSKANRSALVGRAPEDTSFPQGSKNVLGVSVAKLPKDAQEVPKRNSLDKAENPGQSASSSSEALVDAFERISVGGGECGENSENGQSFDCKGRAFQNFPNTPPKTPHYMEVLELRAKHPVAKRSKFKANVLLAESSGSSCGSSDIPSPRGPPFSLSAEERRHRDKKHLDDITAARLPPLHHEPTQLLSLKDSIAIQIQQKEAYEEMLAKLAAQKLAGRLGPQMACYEPEGEVLGNYREVRDEECYSSAED
ncbi:myocardial zonula adherens protein isoform X2 [Lacerta agilis]|uniref:myocardial zonula adherens protein isoform X2 n=1 Tax=Lacerta agilis TaxID=80427 RepID=UPI00141A463B|nr:myocardial zonula adherens protein isoform X2 [Lacerta agilis]